MNSVEKEIKLKLNLKAAIITEESMVCKFDRLQKTLPEAKKNHAYLLFLDSEQKVTY